MLKSFPHTKLITYIRVEKRCLILHGFRDSKRHVPLGVRATKLIIFILMKQLLFAVYTIFYLILICQTRTRLSCKITS